LKGAAAIPRPEQYDLADLIADIASAEAENEPRENPSLLGPKPMMVTSDPALVRLAICNGVRNAFEAVAMANSGEAHQIVITWGQTDVDYWVAVLDRGPGIVGPMESAFEIGKSTKQGHSGFGLAIARQAIETLGGTVVLEPIAQGGAKYTARWER
jgi:sensor histidine kinase regulating citrate/malate metabolism